MYGPRPKPFPTSLRTDDPDAEREAQEFASMREEDRAQAAYEAIAEFGPIPCVDDRYEPCDAAYARMEQDPREPDEVWL